MTNALLPCAVLYAKELPRLARFYIETFAMSQVHHDESHVVLELSGFQLIVHAIPPHIAAEISIAEPPEVREESAIKLCLPVQSIQLARSTAHSCGGLVFPENREWTSRDFRACDGYDCEGNVFQARELL